jgi:hypothetical protein
MDYATGLGHQRSAASTAISSPPGTTVLLRIAIIEAPPAMPQASVLGDNAPAPAGPAVHTWRMVHLQARDQVRHETGVTQRALIGLPRQSRARRGAAGAALDVRERSNSATRTPKTAKLPCQACAES